VSVSSLQQVGERRVLLELAFQEKLTEGQSLVGKTLGAGPGAL